MRNFKNIAAKIPILLLFLSLAAVAAPKVALIKILNGTASIDGKDFKHAQMASEGQSLKVSPGSEVRIQLLGSSSELTVAGPKELKIQQQSLSSQAQKVTRGGIEVATDIGDHNSVGAVVTRGSQSDNLSKTRRRALRPVLPPTSKNGSLMVEYDGGDTVKLPTGAEVTVMITPVSKDVEGYLQVSFKKDLSALEMAPDSIIPGESYEFALNYALDDTQVCHYSQSFRRLTADQRTFLQEAQVEMMERYNQEKSVLPILRLASLYQDLDQNREVLKYLEVARRSPYLQENDVKLRKHLDDLITRFQASLDMTIPVLD